MSHLHWQRGRGQLVDLTDRYAPIQIRPENMSREESEIQQSLLAELVRVREATPPSPSEDEDPL